MQRAAASNAVSLHSKLESHAFNIIKYIDAFYAGEREKQAEKKQRIRFDINFRVI